MSVCTFIFSCKLLNISKISDVIEKLSFFRNQGQSIGFVPTMGALHDGHASLIKKSVAENDYTIVSVFVNPKQFNNPEDLIKYPRHPEKDAEFLASLGVDIAFFPLEEEIYDASYQPVAVDLGRLGEVMEGKMRPGHFDGVVQVLSRLFKIIQPQKAYFGLKDFQQVAVVKKMVQQLNLPVEIVPCPIFREISGLAFSSRNQRLSEKQRKEAVFISRSLQHAKELAKSNSPQKVVELMQKEYAESTLELEYFEIVDPITLESLNENWVPNAVACVVAYCGDVRLIDNMTLN